MAGFISITMFLVLITVNILSPEYHTEKTEQNSDFKWFNFIIQFTLVLITRTAYKDFLD